MHPNEHLVEQYIRIIKKWFTVTNIKFGTNREIDILALDAKGSAYHIEVDVHKGGLQWGPEGSGHYTVKEYKARKFDAETKRFIKDRYGIRKTHDIWVCWGIDPKVKNRALKEAKKHNIEIWELREKLKELMDSIGTASYGDDIIQSLSLIKKADIKQ
jgi:hypothetical protein